jgi:hypothetical protein
MVQLQSQKEGESLLPALLFIGGEGGYDITDYYRVLIVSQGAFGVHILISLLLFGIAVSCDSEETAITLSLWVGHINRSIVRLTIRSM